MLKTNFVNRAIKLALMGAVASLPTQAVLAAESDDENANENKVTITGSRISRTDMETALPVTIISEEEIKATGLLDIGSVVAQMPFNTQGSFISDAGSSATNHSSSGLRGLGSNRTLTLINGRRIAPSATFGGESTNLNLIPIDAVERIDILRDGAAAIYGSDAIGGVINIVLKKDYEGLLLKANFGRPSGDSGDEDGVSLTLGIQGEKGSALVVVEHKEWEGIRYGTRAPVLNADFDLPYNRSSLYAPEGNYHPVDGTGAQSGPWVPGNGSNCPADRIVDLGANGQRCGYAFLDGKNYIPARTKDSIFTNIIYEISDTLTWETAIMALRDTTNTASTSVWTPGGIFMAADNPNNPTFGTANPIDIQAYTRLVGVADRETYFNSNVYHFGSTLSYETEAGILDFYISSSRNEVNVSTDHYIFRDKFDEAVQAGLYNPFVLGGDASEETLNSFLHTSTRRALTSTKGFNVTWSGDSDVELGGGNLAYAVGGEYQEYRFTDRLDRQSAPGGNAFPTFGGNSGGSRDYRAIYAEVDLPVTDQLNIKAATRYDEYSLPDEGQLSSSVNFRYEVTEGLVLRASYSQGFRAPSIDDLLSEEALSFNSVTDTLRCNAGDDPGLDWCSDGEQIERRSEGNPNLQPETSDQFAFGAVWDITDDVSLTVDYYDIQINDQVQFLGAQDVVDLEAAGLLDTFDRNAVNVIRDANNIITNVQTGSINQKGTSTDGIDLSLKAKFETDQAGTFYADFNGSYVLSYETQSTPLAERYDEVGSVTTPEYRYNISFGNTYEAFTSRLTYRYIAAYNGTTVVEDIVGVQADPLESWGILDLNFSYDAEEYGIFSLGIRNAADKLPKLNQTFRNGFDDANHSVEGRVVYGSYSINF